MRLSPLLSIFMRSLVVAVSAAISLSTVSLASELTHGIAMQGKPALAAGFSHFPYANPVAPKGGKLSYGVGGTFDSLNPFVIKSIRTTARGLWDPVLGNLVFETLLKRSRDEPFSLYGLLGRQSTDGGGPQMDRVPSAP